MGSGSNNAQAARITGMHPALGAGFGSDRQTIASRISTAISQLQFAYSEAFEAAKNCEELEQMNDNQCATIARLQERTSNSAHTEAWYAVVKELGEEWTKYGDTGVECAVNMIRELKRNSANYMVATVEALRVSLKRAEANYARVDRELSMVRAKLRALGDE